MLCDFPSSPSLTPTSSGDEDDDSDHSLDLGSVPLPIPCQASTTQAPKAQLKQSKLLFPSIPCSEWLAQEKWQYLNWWAETEERMELLKQ
ncbi:hypothetical protein FRC11_002938, partial [Ceratobasidium sp. 423]